MNHHWGKQQFQTRGPGIKGRGLWERGDMLACRAPIGQSLWSLISCLLPPYCRFTWLPSRGKMSLAKRSSPEGNLGECEVDSFVPHAPRLTREHKDDRLINRLVAQLSGLVSAYLLTWIGKVSVHSLHYFIMSCNCIFHKLRSVKVIVNLADTHLFRQSFSQSSRQVLCQSLSHLFTQQEKLIIPLIIDYASSSSIIQSINHSFRVKRSF